MPEIVKPVFVVSMPRSGSTIFQKLLFVHPDIVTTTNASKKCPTSVFLTRFLARFYYRELKPGEGGRMWDRFVGPGSDVLDAADVTPAARSYFTRAVAAHLDAFPGTRFLARCPRNGMRIRYFSEIFPDALFVHLVRDGRAVCHSVLRQREKDGTVDKWWDVRPAGWREMADLAPVASVATQWKAVVDFIEEAGSELGPNRYLRLRYEDLVSEPEQTLHTLGSFCDLDCPHPSQDSLVKTLADRNYKWPEMFTSEDLSSMHAIMGDALSRYGYADNLT